MALNLLYQLMDRVTLTQSNIIDALDNKTKMGFIIMMDEYAKSGENHGDLKVLADETFMWWNPNY